MPTSDLLQLTYYRAVDEGVLPSSARQPWTALGGGGSHTDKGVVITASTALVGYERQEAQALAADRLELQAQFDATSDSPGWSSGASGHVMMIDDGNRALGVAIGSQLEIINPATGAVLFVVDTDNQPGGSTAVQNYHLIKEGTSTWQVWVDGRLVAKVPYAAGATATFSVATFRWGWLDASGSGVGRWDRVETGINESLPPHWKVDRARSAMPGPLQAEWTPRHEAFLRALVGLSHQTQDRMSRLWDAFTAQVIPLATASFDGSELPSVDGWTLVGDTGQISVVRERVRIEGSTNVTNARYNFTTPTNTDGIHRCAARFVVREYTTTEANGRVGPYMVVENGHRHIGAVMLHDLSDPEAVGWKIVDAGQSAATLGNTGEFLHLVDPFQDSFVELFVIGRERVILFVNGDLVDDRPYSDFSEASSNYRATIGRNGSALIDCDVDIDKASAAIEYGDNAYRTLFLRRIAERLLFSGGCERNDVLDTWLRHRQGVFEARGTDRVISEIRRIACDDDATMVYDKYPGDWYLGVTYPGVSPTFFASQGLVSHITAEFRALAPNFTPDKLEELIAWYLLPRGALDAPVRAALATDLTSGLTTVSGESEFSVESVAGFAVGDPVTLRGSATGNLIGILYDSDEGMSELATEDVRDFSGNNDHGTLTNSGADASIGNTPAPALDGVVIPDDASAGQMEGIQSPGTVSVTVASGFTVAGWFRNDITHDATAWDFSASPHGVGTGGFRLGWSSGGDIIGVVYDAVGSVSTPASAYNPAAGTWFHLALRWESGPGTLEVWRDGVMLTTVTNGAFTALNPGAGAIGFGCDDAGANRFKGRHRDHILFERALSDSEMADLYNETTGRDPLREDSNILLAYLPSGYPAILATHTGSPLGADYMLGHVSDGWAWATWELISEGELGDGIAGQFTFAGLDTHKLANITPGTTVTVTGAAASVDTWVEVFGLHHPSGNPTSERIRADGTTPAVSTTTWAEVHGVASDSTQLAAIDVDETGGATLFTLGVGQVNRGVQLYREKLLCGPSIFRVSADAATTDDIIPYGVEAGGVDGGEEITLSGTSTVTSSRSYHSLRAIAAGYLAAARTCTVTMGIADPDGQLRIISDNVADTQGFRVVYMHVDGTARSFVGTLNGTTAVPIINGGVWHVLGVILDSAPTGTVTLSFDGGIATLTVTTLSGAQRRKGIDDRRIANVDRVYAELETAQTVAPFVAYWGIDEDGNEVTEALELDGTGRVYGKLDIVEVLGFAMGNVPQSTHVRFGGIAWRAENSKLLADQLVALKGWDASASGSALKLDGLLQDTSDVDLTLGGVNFSGAWSVTEDSEITTLVGGTTIRTTLLSGSFSSGDVMRKR